MNIYKRILKNLSEILITLAIFGLIPAIVFGIITSKTDLLLGIRSFNVLTGSMQPSIPVGSLVFTMDAKNYQVGDVVTYKRGEISVTHRIVGISNGKFITKGDANNNIDVQLVNREDIIGRNFFIAPEVGKLTNFVKTVQGFLILIVFPTLVFVGFEILNVKKEWEKEIKKRLMKELENSINPYELKT